MVARSRFVVSRRVVTFLLAGGAGGVTPFDIVTAPERQALCLHRVTNTRDSTIGGGKEKIYTPAGRRFLTWYADLPSAQCKPQRAFPPEKWRRIQMGQMTCVCARAGSLGPLFSLVRVQFAITSSTSWPGIHRAPDRLAVEGGTDILGAAAGRGRPVEGGTEKP